MKTIMTLMTSLFIPAAFACADFSGNYSCFYVEEDGSKVFYDMDVVQSGNVFTITDDQGTETVVADGKPYQYEGAEMAYSCSGNKVISVGKIDIEGFIIDVDFEIIKKGNQIDMITVATYDIGNGPQSEVTEAYCNRK